MAIGNKIVSLRKKYSYTQEKLANKVGVSRQTLSNWESDLTSPDLTQAKILSELFKISLDELCDNNLEITCKDESESIFNDILGKTIYLTFTDDYFDDNINSETPVKLINCNEDFIKIEYTNNKKSISKLIDINLIDALRVVEEDL